MADWFLADDIVVLIIYLIAKIYIADSTLSYQQSAGMFLLDYSVELKYCFINIGSCPISFTSCQFQDQTD